MLNNRRKKIGEYYWSNVKPQIVKDLPDGIDGLQIYVLKKTGNKQTNNQALQDGRRAVQQNGWVIGVFDLLTAKDHTNASTILVLSKYSLV
jgi:hypothetical protein